MVEKHDHPPSHHWNQLPISQKMLTVSLLMFVFVLPVTLGFLGQSKDIRQQAALEEPPISIPLTPDPVDPTPTIDPTISPISTVSVTPACAAASRPANRKADFNNSGQVDLTDYTILSIEFLRDLATYRADTNCDHKVDLTDYTRLSIEFLH